MDRVAQRSIERVSVLGPTSDLHGEFVTEAELTVLGQFTGDLLQAPVITIGPGARVQATIHTRSIRIEGAVIGDIHAEVAVIIQASARLQGSIHCPNITIRDGAQVNCAANLGRAAAATGHGERDGGHRDDGIAAVPPARASARPATAGHRRR